MNRFKYELICFYITCKWYFGRFIDLIHVWIISIILWIHLLMFTIKDKANNPYFISWFKVNDVVNTNGKYINILDAYVENVNSEIVTPMTTNNHFIQRFLIKFFFNYYPLYSESAFVEFLNTYLCHWLIRSADDDIHNNTKLQNVNILYNELANPVNIFMMKLDLIAHQYCKFDSSNKAVVVKYPIIFGKIDFNQKYVNRLN